MIQPTNPTMTDVTESQVVGDAGVPARMSYRRQRTWWQRVKLQAWQWHRHQRGATTLEWAMLLMTIGIPAAMISFVVLRLLGQYSRMTLTLTNLPWP